MVRAMLTHGTGIQMMRNVWPALALGVVLPLSAFATLSAVKGNITARVDALPTTNVAEASVALPPLYVSRELKVRSGETFATVLQRTGFNASEIKSILASLKERNVGVSNLKAGTEMTLSYTESSAYDIDNANLEFRYGPGQIAHVKVADDVASVQIEKRALKNTQAVAVGRINDSLYEDATNAGVPAYLIRPFMDLFAWDIDYTRDIHPGDTFKVVYEETQDDLGNRVKTGRILAASMTVGKETRQAFWFADENGRGDYYNEKGETKRKLLLRTPLEVYRISSGFGARRHPVLGFTRMHKGTDFAAPAGTPIKASGDGVITFRGWHGGHGNYIKIKHTGTYSTAYGHMLRYASGINVGSKVKQGQIIGYVGSTGVSTGPHLHYEVHKNSAQVDPMRTDLPTGVMVAGKAKSRFKALVADITTRWNRALIQVAENEQAKKKG